MEHPMRHSKVVYILIRLRMNDRDHVVIQRHRKWGDWSFVGGHVEPHEETNWDLAAARAVEEELAPLRVGRDVQLVPLDHTPSTWGPVSSRSHKGKPTVYHARWYALQFLVDRDYGLENFDWTNLMLVEPTSSKMPALFARFPAGISVVPDAHANVASY